jgi:hypothetical protein
LNLANRIVDLLDLGCIADQRHFQNRTVEVCFHHHQSIKISIFVRELSLFDARFSGTDCITVFRARFASITEAGVLTFEGQAD